MLRQATLFTLTLTAMSAARADGLTPVGPASADVRLCYASGSSGPQVPCVLQDQTWMQLQRPTDPADRMTIAPSATAPAGTLANTIVPSYALTLLTAYMPPPSGSDLTDAANFAVAQATSAQVVVFQAGTYLVPPAGYAQLRSNQIIRGQGSTLTILRGTGQGTSSDGMLYALSKSDAGIAGITVDYGNFREPQNKAGVFGLRDVARFRIEDVNIIGFSRFGLNTNSISDFVYSQGNVTRSTNPLDANGAPIAKGQVNRCVQVSQNVGSSIRLRFEDVTTTGCAFGVGGEDVDYVRTSVAGFDYGFAYVTDQWPNARAHRFINVKASGGHSNPVTGEDVDHTRPGCFEIWAKDSIVDNSECSDMGGDGAAIGGQNIRMTNNKFSKLGMFAPANGIVGRYQDTIYNANGSLVANNLGINTNGSGDGSSLALPYVSQDNSPDINVTIVGNDFGTISLRVKNAGEVWSSPGMLVSGHSGEYAHTPCSTRGPLGLFFRGALRRRDAIVGVTYIADNGAALPSNIRAYAEVNADNNIEFYTQDTRPDCSGPNTPVPSGTFSARLITIN